MSKIPGFVIGPAGPPPVYYNQPVQYAQAVPQAPNTVYIPPVPPGSRVVINQAPVVYASQPPGNSVVYVNRSQPGQLAVLGGRLGTSIGQVVDSALAAPPPQYAVYHQYTTPAPGPAPPPPYVQYPQSNPQYPQSNPPNYQEKYPDNK